MPSDTTTNPSTLLDAQGRAMNQAADQAREAGDQLVGAIRRQPLTAALVIFIIGYALGKIT